MFSIEPEQSVHHAQVEALLDVAFGPGRFTKTAYRLREGVREVSGLSFVAFDSQDGRMVGSIRFWPILMGAAPGLLLGPLAVDPGLRGKGCGIALMERGLEAARLAGHKLVLLVGDEAYYKRVGFAQVPSGRLSMPGPVNVARLLYRELAPGAFEAAEGAVVAAPPHPTLPLKGGGL